MDTIWHYEHPHVRHVAGAVLIKPLAGSIADRVARLPREDLVKFFHRQLAAIGPRRRRRQSAQGKRR